MTRTWLLGGAALLACASPPQRGTAWQGQTSSAGSSDATGTPPDGSSGPGGRSTSSPPSTTAPPSTTDVSTSDMSSTDTDPGSASATTTGTPLPDPGAEIGSFQLTYYWVTEEAEFDGTPSETLYNPDCDALATVAPEFADALRLEGTGRLTDGRVLNYWNTCGCANSPCFFEVGEDQPWGAGVQNRPLVPFRSLAVDEGVVEIGAWLYVAELDGVMMPGEAPWGGFMHDGCVVADDIGGGINGQHIDFFSALRVHYLSLDGLLGLTHVTVHAPGERCGD